MLSRSDKLLFKNVQNGKLGVNNIVKLHCEEPMTILCYAISLQNFEWVSYLVDNGADVNLGVSGTTPLTEAVMCTSYSTFRQIVSKLMEPRAGHSALNFSCTSHGRSLIQELITFQQDEDYLWFLLDNNFNINTQSKDIIDANGGLCRITDYTPFLYCVQMRNFTLAKQLCARGACPNIKGTRIAYHRKYTAHPLEVACFHSTCPANERLRDVRQVLELKANVDTRDQRGMTCLHVAAEREMPRLCQLLIAYGANVNIRSEIAYKYQTPIEFAEIPKVRQEIWTSVCERRIAFCMIVHPRVGSCFGQYLSRDILWKIVSIYL